MGLFRFTRNDICKKGFPTQETFSFFAINQLFNDNRYTFCNSPSISCLIAPSRNTSRPYNRVPCRRRSQDKPLYPCILSLIPQIVYRTRCIYTVKKAFFDLTRSFLPFHYTPQNEFWQPFLLHKIAFPSKKLSKNPLTSKPERSKLPIKSPTLAI